MSSQPVWKPSWAYTVGVPRLWNDTIQAHRAAVNDAILDTTAALVAKHGLRSVTMSQIAEQTGIGRATLYKYFPDVEAILAAWHERQIAAHLQQLTELRDQAGDALASVSTPCWRPTPSYPATPTGIMTANSRRFSIETSGSHEPSISSAT